MRNRKTSLIFRAILIVALTLLILFVPTEEGYRKWLRFGMLVFFVVTFIIDFTKYKKENEG
jgi:membrane-bound metal-dependent hydrolase YbcI (DUF457 family)